MPSRKDTINEMIDRLLLSNTDSNAILHSLWEEIDALLGECSNLRAENAKMQSEILRLRAIEEAAAEVILALTERVKSTEQQLEKHQATKKFHTGLARLETQLKVPAPYVPPVDPSQTMRPGFYRSRMTEPGITVPPQHAIGKAALVEEEEPEDDTPEPREGPLGH
jgi:hypothetical protein